MGLAERLLSQFFTELVNSEKVYYTDIYRVRTIKSALNDGFLFSCRFKNACGNAFLLSIHINLKNNNPRVRCSVSLLCPRRIFSRTLFFAKVTLPFDETLIGIMKQEKYNNYYKINRSLPIGITANIFNKYIKAKLKTYINTIKKENFLWQ